MFKLGKFFGQKEVLQKVPNVLVFMDYENIAIEASRVGKIVDFSELAKLCRSFGEIVDSVIFITLATAIGHSDILQDARNNGFSVNLSPEPPRDRTTNLVNRLAVKQKDTADTEMIDKGLRWSRFVDSVILITNDKDFLTLVNRLKDQHKNLVLFHGSGVATVLRQVVALRHLVPLKNK